MLASEKDEDAPFSKALCKGSTHLLFPTAGDGEPDLEAPAPPFCALCPCSLACLRKGWDERDGIWGGLSRMERLEDQINKRTPEEAWIRKYPVIPSTST